MILLGRAPGFDDATVVTACSRPRAPFIEQTMNSEHLNLGATILTEIIVLRISDNDCVELDGMTLRSTNEVAEVLGKLRARSPDATISIEADDSNHYEAIGKAIYGTQRAGFSAERLRILVDGKPWGA